MEPVIRAEQLRKVFRQPGGRQVEAVRGATFSAGEGEVLGLLGPNGAGKTTLLRMLGGIVAPSSGYCWIEGVRMDQAPDSARGKIGFLSGNTKLYGRLSAREVLRYFGQLNRMSGDVIENKTASLADLLKMDSILDQRCESLSTGQTQKVSIARAMLHEPKLLILDEPTLGLDIVTSRAIIEFITQAKQAGHCIVFSTHYMSEAELLCDRIVFLHQGDIMAMGSKPELFELSGTASVHDAFLALLDRREGAAS